MTVGSETRGLSPGEAKASPRGVVDGFSNPYQHVARALGADVTKKSGTQGPFVGIQNACWSKTFDPAHAVLLDFLDGDHATVGKEFQPRRLGSFLWRFGPCGQPFSGA